MQIIPNRIVELPSGEIIDMNFVVYVSEIKPVYMQYEFTVLMSNREKITFSFKDKIDCNKEREIFKKYLIDSNNEMICD